MSQVTDSIQDMLISHLHFTPRRLLFEEFNEKLEKIRNRQQSDDKSTQCDRSIASRPQNFQHIRDISAFRVKNARECMTEMSHRRVLRETEKLENFLKHSCVHRFRLNERLIPLPVKSNELGQSLCIICGKAAEDGSCDARNSMIINDSKYGSDKKQHGKQYYLLDATEREQKGGSLRNSSRLGEKSFALKFQNFKY